MKKTVKILLILLCSNYYVAHAQLKIFDDNWISIGSLYKGGFGIQVEPNGYTYFQPSCYGPYAWMNMSISTNEFSKNWIVNWNNTQTFFVYGNGWIYSRGTYIGSDSSFKENIDDIKSPLDKIIKLHGVTFNSKVPKIPDTTRVMDKNGVWHTLTPEEYEYLDTTKFNATFIQQLISERDMKHMGVIAQEVKEVVPEVVRTMPDGTLAVEYYSLIGLLIEAIKEQELKIESMSSIGPLAPLTNGTGLNNTANRNDNNTLYQNVPNPFNKSTIIKYKLASDVSDASVIIFNMEGSLIKTYGGLDRVKGELTISSYELKPGMYIYSLIIDGKEIDTKRMILTQ